MKKGRVYGLDFLRTTALCGVLLFHTFPTVFKGGYFGVLLFFVISGYLAGRSGVKQLDTGDFHVLPYYGKRLKRLYPELLAVVLITVGAMTLTAPLKMADTQEEVLSIFFSYNNEWQIGAKADYFANLSENSPFTHLWYISILVQFEVIWPWLLLLYGAVRKRSRGKALAGAGILCAASFLVMPVGWACGVPVSVLYYRTGCRIFSMLAGAFLGILQAEGLRLRLPGFEEPLLAGFYTLLFSILSWMVFLYADGRDSWVYLSGMGLYTILAVLEISLLSMNRNRIGRRLDIRPVTWISTCSYEIYLWQYPVLFLCSLYGFGTNWQGILLQLVIIFLLSLWLRAFAALLFEKEPK